MTSAIEPSGLVMADGLVRRFSLGLDPVALQHAAAALTELHPLIFDETRQLALQVREGSEDPWYESCYQEKDIAPETSYDQINPELRGTYFETLISSFPFPIYRARLLAIEGRRCYSVHNDATARVHVAIDTTEHARFVFTDDDHVVHVPADGDAYWLDTRRTHSAFNGARNDRIHFVAGANL